jgi:RHS repeat-associated protein
MRHPSGGWPISGPLKWPTRRDFDPETGLDYYRARYYDPNIGRFLSEDEYPDPGDADLYPYVSNGPTNRIDPTGLRDIYVVIWNRELIDGSVGHAVALELDGTVILSQFPDPNGMRGQNVKLDWQDTYAKEGRDP